MYTVIVYFQFSFHTTVGVPACANRIINKSSNYREREKRRGFRLSPPDEHLKNYASGDAPSTCGVK